MNDSDDVWTFLAWIEMPYLAAMSRNMRPSQSSATVVSTSGTCPSFAQQKAASAGALGAGSLVNATNAGVKTQVHELTLGGQYQIADGAKLQLEYRIDLIKPTGIARGITHGGLLNFAYSF